MSASECEATVSPIVERCSVCNTEEWERVGDDDGDEDDHRGMADEARRVKKFQNPRMPSKEEIEITKSPDTCPSGLGAHTAYAARVTSKHTFDNQAVKTAYQKCTWAMPS